MIGHRTIIGLGGCAMATAILLGGSVRAQSGTTVHEVTRELVGTDRRQWCVAIDATSLTGGQLLTTSGRLVGVAEVIARSCDPADDRIMTPDATEEFTVVLTELVEGAHGTVVLTGDDVALALSVPVKERPLGALVLSLLGVVLGAVLAGVLAAAPKLRVLGELDRLVRRSGRTLDRAPLISWVEGVLAALEPREAYSVVHDVTQNVVQWRDEDRARLETALEPHRDSAPHAVVLRRWAGAQRVIVAAERACAQLSRSKIDVNDFVDPLGGRRSSDAVAYVPILDRLADVARHRAGGTSPSWRAVDGFMEAWPASWTSKEGTNFSTEDVESLGAATVLAARVAAEDRRRAASDGVAGADVPAADAAPAAQAPALPAEATRRRSGPSGRAVAKRRSIRPLKGVMPLAAVAALVLLAGTAALVLRGGSSDDAIVAPGTSSDSSPTDTDVTPPGSNPLESTTTTIDSVAPASSSGPLPSLLLIVSVVVVAGAVMIAVRRPGSVRWLRERGRRAVALARRGARARFTPGLIVGFASIVAAAGVFVGTYAGDATYAGPESWIGTSVAGLAVGGAGGLAATVSRFRLSRPRLATS